MSFQDLGVPPRFRGRQRFILAAPGRVAEASYRRTIIEARSRPGRRAFDAARTAWAAAIDLKPDDGVYLGELRAGSASLAELVDALDDCGMKRADAQDALGRLVDAGFVRPVVPDGDV